MWPRTKLRTGVRALLRVVCVWGGAAVAEEATLIACWRRRLWLWRSRPAVKAWTGFWTLAGGGRKGLWASVIACTVSRVPEGALSG